MSQILLKTGQVINSNHVADISKAAEDHTVVAEAMKVGALGYPDVHNMLTVIVGAYDLDNPQQTIQLHTFTNVPMDNAMDVVAIRDTFGEVKTDGGLINCDNGWHISAQPFLLTSKGATTVAAPESVMEEEKGMAEALLTVFRLEILKEDAEGNRIQM